MSEQTIEVQPREARGKNANRRLRAAGMVPAVVYGGGRDTVAIQVGRRKVEELLRQSGSEHSVFLLELAGSGKQRHTMIRELSTDPITGEMIHIDFLRVAMDTEVRVEIPIELVGTPVGVKNEGGMADFVTREVEVECLPGKIPAKIELDITPLQIGAHVDAGDLELPEGVELITEASRTIVSVVGQDRLEEALPEEEEEGLLTDEAAEPELVGEESEGAEASDGE